MNVKWLIEPEVFDGEEYLLEKTLIDRGVEHKAIKFGLDYDDYLTAFDENDCVVVHGSFQLADFLRKKAKWIPGVYCNYAKFDCAYYYPRFGSHLLNENYVMLPFGEMDRRRDWLYDTLGFSFHSINENSLFIRPSSGRKTFTGDVVSVRNWERDFVQFGFYGIEPEEIVVVAPPQQVIGEWRLVVVENKAISASPYHKYDNPFPLEKVVNYGQSVLDEVKYSPDRAWTLDVGQIKSGELKIVEVGSFSCAGLYQCDPNIVIDAVSKVALEEWEEYQ